MNEVKILIVEDELLIAKSLSRKLQALGYTVVSVVSSGLAALQKTIELNPDLILMDIAIKGNYDGIETANMIRESHNIPIVYLTAYADDDTLARAEKSGSYGYILKPFKERELHATIKIALKKHEEQLKIAEILAASQASNEEKKRYISIVSHDLSNPLTAIQISTEILQNYDRQLDEEKKKKQIERIQVAVSNMSELLGDILTLSRAESGKLMLNPIPLNIALYCQNLLAEFSIIATEKHSLKFSDRGECRLVYLDEKLLRHILNNLLSNAIKYSPQGGKISLNLVCKTEQVILQVTDEGIGIPSDYQNKIFQQFERAKNVGKIKGTGLGLSIVKQAVELHQGTIFVESKEGVGTRFTVTLPTHSPRQ
ncbi:hybrid sensor histidine kinase/response regulator [Oscillatoria salina]|uniref:hybrid sensor histidine kinase/response regulator n=1 Tax=Oscillatoria salina TaxID=331517 RepID=UPI0013B93A34|nr:ATP-binding protein [Oscillatoria salina]MBZ8178728.1 hybrid sensor histidine kinase/response regulator [Oscillatoria salina IIICB1]NET89362.1 hybrid sensor histidine kinase/response regulator [Kamptonema sp. SIO1D9]